MKEGTKMLLVLTLVTLISAGVLSLLYNQVKTNIEKQEKAKIDNALNFVMPEAKEFKKIERGEDIYWHAFNEKGELIGYTFIAKKQGFSSLIQIMVGIDLNGIIKRMSVISQAETPGLGAKMEEVESDKYLWSIFSEKRRGDGGEKEPYFLEQFKGLNSKDLTVVKGKANSERNEIEALTGATISSQAIVDGIKEAVDTIFEIENRK